MNPKVSVIIPAYNCENTICRTVDSILNQFYKNIEIIIINDGSTDDTKKVVKKYGNVILYNNENKGVCYSRNFGIKKAKGDYILFVDADDTIDENFISEMIKALKNGQLTGGKIKKIEVSKSSHILQQKSFYSKEEFISALISGEIDGYIWRYLFNKKTLDKIQFNEKLSYMEDTVFLVEYMLQTDISKVKFVDSFYNYYNCSTTSVTNRKSNSITTIKNIKNSINQICRYKEEIKFIDVEYYCLNRKAKLYESQLYKIDNKKSYQELKLSKEFKNEIMNLLKSDKTKKYWKIFYKIIIKSPYCCFCFYQSVRGIIKKVVRS